MNARAWGIIRNRPLTVDELNAGLDTTTNPSWWVDSETGFFVASFGRWREFGFCCGRMRWGWQYTGWLMRRVKSAVELTKNTTRQAA